MDYQITLDSKDFGQRQDPMFYLGESFELATGNGWSCRLVNCGEQGLWDADHTIRDDDVLAKYDTDDKLNKAINENKVIIVNNSWWELSFYKEDDNSSWYLDLPVDTVTFSADDAIALFKELMADTAFIDSLQLALQGDADM